MMNLSKSSIDILIDMIENKLTMIQIGDREELREVLALQTCLRELQGLIGASTTETTGSTRGRRRKLSSLLEDAGMPETMRKLA